MKQKIKLVPLEKSCYQQNVQNLPLETATISDLGLLCPGSS